MLAALATPPAIAPAEAADDVVRLLTWPTYTREEVLAEFTAETGLRVEVTVAQSNEEMAAAIRAGDPPYDVVVPSDSWVALLAEEDLLVPFDATTLEGFERIDDPWLGAYFDPGMLYSIPFLWGTTSFMVNTEVYGGPRDSLALLFEPPEEVRGKVGMMTDARDALDLALRYLGLPGCTDDPDHLEQVRALLEHQATFIADYTMEDIVSKTVRGDLAVQMIYNGAAMRAREENPAVAYVYPKEGVTVWSDNLVIPANASNKAGARTFLEYFLRPEVIAAHSNKVRYGNTIRGSQQFLDDDLKDAPELLIPPNVPINFVEICNDDVVAGYTALWRDITGIED
jgi:spermidine/putrescine transport system substrate-binding protein